MAGGTLLAAADDQIVLPEQVLPQLGPILAGAVNQSPRLILRNLDLMAAEGELVQAKAGLLPNVSGYYQVSKAREVREDLSGSLETDKIAYNLVLSQPVFHWNERRNNARIGELRRHIAGEQYHEAHRLLVQEIRSIYLQLIQKKIQVANAGFERDRAGRALRLAETRLEGKEISEADIFQTRIAHDRQQLAVEQAELELLQLKQALAALTGQPQPADDSLPEGLGPLASSQPGIERMLAVFLGRTEPVAAPLRILRQNIEAEDLTYRNHRRKLRPKFNFVAGITQDEQSYTANIGQKYGVQSRYVGLQAVWSIFDGHAARGAASSALARKRQLELSLRHLKETLGQDAQRAARQADLAFRQMQISDRLLANAQAALDYRRADRERGLAAEDDVAAAEAGYRNVFAAAVAARCNYLLRVADFVSLAGEDPAAAASAGTAQSLP